jgi:hypothetical protein
VSIQSTKWPSGLVRAAFAILAVLPFAAANAEFVRVTATDALTNSVYDVTSFSNGGATNPLNTDGAKHGSYRAVVQITNLAAGTVDVLVADATLGQVIRYTPAVGATPASETVVWSYTGTGSGPAHPDGLSLDSKGNLYMITSKSNDGTFPSVWVLPTNGTGGFTGTPLLIDGTSFGMGNGNTVLQDTAVAIVPGAAWGVDDLLVLVGNKTSELARYTAAQIQTVLSGGGPVTPQVLISNAQFPITESPTGLDFWPVTVQGGHPTLLIATTAGNVWQYDFDPVTLAPSSTFFAGGLGSGLMKVKVGLQVQVPYAFVTQVLTKSKGQILQLGAPLSPGAPGCPGAQPCTNLVGTATKGIVDPDGLAVARAASVPASSCVFPNTCDISNGADPHQITGPGSGSVSGNVTERTCVVLTDPRYLETADGTCNDRELDISTLPECQNFGKVSVQGLTCGGAGTTGKGFALAIADAPGVDLAGLPIVVATIEGADAILKPPANGSNPSCKTFSANPFTSFLTILWGPRTDANPSEGTTVEAQSDPLGLSPLIDMGGDCDAPTGFSRGGSVIGIGFIYNKNRLNSPGALANLATTKFNNLKSMVDQANISAGTKATLEAALAQINTFLGQQDFACAANAVVAANALVANDQNPALNYPGDQVFDTNPWGEAQGRLANEYVALNTLNLGNPTNAEWPPVTSAPPVCAPQITSFTAPAAVLSGQSPALTWAASHATSCSIAGTPGGYSAPGLGVSGNINNAPGITATTTYTLTCSNPYSASVSQQVTVTAVQTPTINSFTSSAPSVLSGGTVTLSWSSNAMSCAISGTDGFAANGNGSGSAVTAPITAPTTYALACSNSSGGVTATANAASTITVIVVTKPTIGSFSASPANVLSGGSVTLTWTSNAMSCAISGSPGGYSATGLQGSGSVVVASLTVTTTFTLACSNASGGVTATATASPVGVTVTQPVKINSFTANPSTVDGDGDRDDAVTLSWSASTAAANPTTCAITGGGLNATKLGATGSLPAGIVKVQTTYTLNCSNSGSNASANTKVTVTPDHDD